MKRSIGSTTGNGTDGGPLPRPDSFGTEAKSLFRDLSDLNATLLTQGSMTVSQAERVRQLIEHSNRLLNRPSGLIAAAKELMGTNMVGPDAKIFQGKNIGKVPPLPADILEVLKSRCQLANDGRTVAETHRLVLLPATIDGATLTLNSLGNWADTAGEDGVPILFCRQDWYEKEAFANAPLEKSQWILEYEDVAPGTIAKTDSQQIDVVRKLLNYQTAKVLEHVCTMLFQEIENSERIHTNFFGRCEERSNSGVRVHAGRFTSLIRVSHSADNIAWNVIGRAIVRKLNTES